MASSDDFEDGGGVKVMVTCSDMIPKQRQSLGAEGGERHRNGGKLLCVSLWLCVCVCVADSG